MRSTIVGMTLLALAGGAVGCGFVRTPDMYRSDTEKLLTTRNVEIKACYDGILKGDQKAAGSVTVRFDVLQDTGKLVNVKLDEAASTAPPPVRECVMQALQGLVLQKPDANLGKATFMYEFQAGPAPAPQAAVPVAAPKS
jgi:hypothetical protein